MLRFSNRWRWSFFVVLFVWFSLGLWGSLLFWNTHRQAEHWLEENSRLSVIMQQPLAELDYQNIYLTLSQDVRIGEITEVTPQKSFEKLQQQLEEHPDFFAGIPQDILPLTIEIKLRPGYYSRMDEVAEKLQALRGVDQVLFAQHLLVQLDGLRQRLSGWYHLLVIMFVLGGWCISAHWSRLVWTSEQESIVLLRRLGASMAVIRLQFLKETGILGMAGMALAAGFSWLGIKSGSFNGFFPDLLAVEAQAPGFFPFDWFLGFGWVVWFGMMASSQLMIRSRSIP